MANIRKPRRGSMQFWPRGRARRIYPKVGSWPSSDKPVPLGFAGYKVGMSHIQAREKVGKKIETIFYPVTVLECPPLKVASIIFLKIVDGKKVLVSEVNGPQDKELSRKTNLSKKKEAKKVPEAFDDIMLKVYTQPKLTGFGKKTPELFEIAVGGKKEDKLNYALDHLGKEISVTDVIKAGDNVDIHGVTKGKGYQGPVKRFGVDIRAHKSEKTKRGPGSLGGWRGQGHIMYRVAHAGQMGYHTRTEYNKWILKISENPAEINPAGDFIGYGRVKTQYILVKGSVMGPSKRLIRFNPSIRQAKKLQAPEITFIDTTSPQGN